MVCKTIANADNRIRLGALLLMLVATGLPVATIEAAAVPVSPSSTPNAQEQTYINNFIAYWTNQGQIPDTVPRLEDYAVASKYDQYYMGSTSTIWAQRIAEDRNLEAGMAWGSSYQTHSYNDMYRATRDVKYLRENLVIARASLANRDDKVGVATFFGDYAPGWGTPYYAGRHVIHPVHTGMIAIGIVDLLELIQLEPDLLAELGDEYQTMIDEITETLDWHDRQWIDGPASDEGFYIFKDNEPSEEGKVLPGNRLSAMGLALWGSWKASGNVKHRDQALKVGRYMKRRMGLYTGTQYGEGAYFWRYDLALNPLPNPLPESQVSSLNGGEDFSHAALTVAFPLTLGLAGEVFTQDDMDALARTIILGFGRLGDGILMGNVVGTTVFGPDQVLIPGYFLRIGPRSVQAYDVIAEFLLRYQKIPRNVDLSQLILYRQLSMRSNAAYWLIR